MTHNNDTNARKELPAGWRWARLGEVCDINPSKSKGFKRKIDALTTFIPMAAVDGDLGQIVAPRQRLYQEVSRGYTYFAEGDVLFAKITPCMQNKKSAIVRGLIDGVGFGTTEFHVLRPQNEILAEWIYFQLREPTFLALAEANFTGAVGQQRVPASFLEQYSIPLPPLATQRAIARQLERDMAEVARLRAAAERQRAAAAALPAAYLREVFESVEARGWPVVRLGDVCDRITDGTHDPPPFTTNGVPFLFVKNIVAGKIDFNVAKYVSQQTYEELTRRCRPERGDILYSAVGSFGVAVVIETDQPFTFQRHIAIIKAKKNQISPQFAAHYLNSPEGRKKSEEVALGGAQRTVTLKSITNFKLPLPPLSQQYTLVQQLERDIAEVTRLRAAADRQRAAIDAMPAALLREVFGGFAG